MGGLRTQVLLSDFFTAVAIQFAFCGRSGLIAGNEVESLKTIEDCLPVWPWAQLPLVALMGSIAGTVCRQCVKLLFIVDKLAFKLACGVCVVCQIIWVHVFLTNTHTSQSLLLAASLFFTMLTYFLVSLTETLGIFVILRGGPAPRAHRALRQDGSKRGLDRAMKAFPKETSLHSQSMYDSHDSTPETAGPMGIWGTIFAVKKKMLQKHKQKESVHESVEGAQDFQDECSKANLEREEECEERKAAVEAMKKVKERRRQSQRTRRAVNECSEPKLEKLEEEPKAAAELQKEEEPKAAAELQKEEEPKKAAELQKEEEPKKAAESMKKAKQSRGEGKGTDKNKPVDVKCQAEATEGKEPKKKEKEWKVQAEATEREESKKKGKERKVDKDVKAKEAVQFAVELDLHENNQGGVLLKKAEKAGKVKSEKVQKAKAKSADNEQVGGKAKSETVGKAKAGHVGNAKSAKLDKAVKKVVTVTGIAEKVGEAKVGKSKTEQIEKVTVKSEKVGTGRGNGKGGVEEERKGKEGR